MLVDSKKYSFHNICKLNQTSLQSVADRSSVGHNLPFKDIREFKAKFRRRTSHEPNRMQMRKILCSPSLAFDSAHVKYGVWTWPKINTTATATGTSLKVY